MLDWIDSLLTTTEQFFYELGENINNVFVELDNLVNSFNQFVEVATYYIYGSGALLAIILLISIVNQVKISKLQKKIDLLLEDRGIRQNE